MSPSIATRPGSAAPRTSGRGAEICHRAGRGADPPDDPLSVAGPAATTGPEVSDAAATALELIHCASLVHDDLPCFDDADTAPRQAVGAQGVFRTAGGADRRQPDRAGLRGAGAGDRDRSRRGAALDLALARPHRHAGRHLCRAGLGKRGDRSICAPITAPRPGRCSSPPPRWAPSPPGTTRKLARSRRADRRGLPGGRRSARRAVAGRGPRQAGRAGRLARPAERGGRAGRRGRPRPPRISWPGAIASIPSCPGEAQLAQMVRAQARQIVPTCPPRPIGGLRGTVAPPPAAAARG